MVVHVSRLGCGAETAGIIPRPVIQVRQPRIPKLRILSLSWRVRQLLPHSSLEVSEHAHRRPDDRLLLLCIAVHLAAGAQS